MKRPIYINFLLAALLAVLLAVIFCTGCSSVKKTQENYKATTDSTRRLNVDSSTLATVDSGHLHRTDSFGRSRLNEQHHTVVTITLDSADNYGPTDKDYMPVDDLRNPGRKSVKIKLDSSGEVTVDLGNRRPAKIEIIKSGEISRIDSSRVKRSDSLWVLKKDSTGVSISDSGSLKKTVETKSSSKNKLGPAFFVVAPLCLLFFAFMFFFIWRKVRRKS